MPDKYKVLHDVLGSPVHQATIKEDVYDFAPDSTLPLNTYAAKAATNYAEDEGVHLTPELLQNHDYLQHVVDKGEGFFESKYEALKPILGGAINSFTSIASVLANPQYSEGLGEVANDYEAVEGRRKFNENFQIKDNSTLYYDPNELNPEKFGQQVLQATAESLPLSLVGGLAGGAVRVGVSSAFKAAGFGLGKLAAKTAMNNLGIIATNVSKFATSNLLNNVSSIAGGFVTSRAIGEFNALQTEKETYDEAIKKLYDKKIESIVRENPNISYQDAMDYISDDEKKAIDAQASKYSLDAGNTVRNMSWLTGFLNVTSSAKLVGASLWGKNKGLIWGNFSRNQPYANTYAQQNLKEFLTEGFMETVEELMEGASQNYAKETALKGKGSKSLLEGWGDVNSWKSLYDLTFSEEGMHTALLSVGMTGLLQGARVVKDLKTGEIADHNKKNIEFKKAESLYGEFKNSYKEFENAKTEEEKANAFQKVQSTGFYKNLNNSLLDMNKSSFIAETANKKGLEDISELTTQTNFGKQLWNAFSLGLGAEVQNSLDALNSKEFTNAILESTNSTQNETSNEGIKNSIFVAKDITKKAEKIFNKVNQNHSNTPQLANTLYNAYVSLEIAKSHKLKHDIKVSNLLTDLVSQSQDLMNTFSQITEKEDLKRYDTNIYDEAFDKQNQELQKQGKSLLSLEDYKKERVKQEALSQTIASIQSSIETLENSKTVLKDKMVKEETVKKEKEVDEQKEIDKTKAKFENANPEVIKQEKEKLQSNLENIQNSLEDINNDLENPELNNEERQQIISKRNELITELQSTNKKINTLEELSTPKVNETLLTETSTEPVIEDKPVDEKLNNTETITEESLNSEQTELEEYRKLAEQFKVSIEKIKEVVTIKCE